MYDDDVNLLYLSYLQPILVELQRVNKLFESNDVDPMKLLNDLLFLIDSLVKRVTAPNIRFDIFTHKIEDYVDNNAYMGYLFESQCQKMKKGNLDNILIVKTRCIKFVINLINQLIQRLPENIKILKKISVFSVENTLKVNKEEISDILKLSGVSAFDITKIENQFRNLILCKWENTTKTIPFWSEVLNFTDAAGNNPFLEIATFVISLLVLPISNAEIERIFSHMSIIKNKYRNKMSSYMLNAIMTIRAAFRRNKNCCYNYEVPSELLTKIHSNDTYTSINLEDLDFPSFETLFI